MNNPDFKDVYSAGLEVGMKIGKKMNCSPCSDCSAIGWYRFFAWFFCIMSIIISVVKK